MKKINRDFRRQIGRGAAWALALMCCLQPIAQAEKSATNNASNDCGCSSRFRTYGQSPTAIQQALFAAAYRADADDFMRLLPLSGALGDLAFKDEPILAAIIRPDPELKSTGDHWSWSNPPERDRLVRAHRATLGARLSMLRAALAQGARPNDVTNAHRLPALHQAIAFGSPDMVDALLEHGADPRQLNEDTHLSPLEFLLDHEFFLRRRSIPEMLTRDERARIAARLVRAGSPVPRQVNWTELVSLVSGNAWLSALLNEHAPSPQDLMDTSSNALPTATAAYLGDTLALQTLLKHLPTKVPNKYDPDKKPPFDLQLDAAIAALQGGHTELARSLLRPDMPWTQEGPKGAPRMGRYIQTGKESEQTILEVATDLGDIALATQLLDWGAPTDDALMVAVKGRNETLIRLFIQRGANPVSRTSLRYDGTPLTLAIQQAPELLPALLTNPTEATRKALQEEAHSLLRSALESPVEHRASQRPLIEALLQAGVSGPELKPFILAWAIRAGDIGAIEALHAAKAPWPPQALSHALSTGRTDLIERVVQLSGQSLSDVCPRDYDSLIRLVREAPPFADRLLDQGMLVGPCGNAGPLAHRLLKAWLAPQSRPLMGTRFQRAQELLQRLWQVDPSQRELPRTLLEEPITHHRPDVLTLALQSQPPTQDTLGALAQIALDARNPEALRAMRAHGLSAHTHLPDGHTLSWHLGCDKPVTWRPLAGFSDLPAPTCAKRIPKPPTTAEKALAKALPGTYYLSGVRDVGSELTMRTDGSYSQSTSYGAVDQFVEGRWQVDGNEIVFKSKEVLPTPFFGILKAWYEPGGQGLGVRASSNGRLMRGFIVMTVGSQNSFIDTLGPRGEEGWTEVGNLSAVGQLEGLAIAVATGQGLRWTLMPLSPDKQGRMPNRIDVEVNLEAQTPPSSTLRMRLDKGALVRVDDPEGRARYERHSRD